jgi:transcriptional regulator with XRE-family HTH domain
MTPKQVSVNIDEIAARTATVAKRMGLSLRALAREIDLPYRSLQNYLSGESRLPADVVVRAAKALGVETDFLFFGRVSLNAAAVRKSLEGALEDVLPRLMTTGRAVKVRDDDRLFDVGSEAAAALRAAVVEHLTAQMQQFYEAFRETSLGADWTLDMEKSLKAKAKTKGKKSVRQ